jgi:hypothetical protein
MACALIRVRRMVETMRKSHVPVRSYREVPTIRPPRNGCFLLIYTASEHVDRDIFGFCLYSNHPTGRDFERIRERERDWNPILHPVWKLTKR